MTHSQQEWVVAYADKEPVTSVSHEDCNPGGRMCPSCAALWREASAPRRHLRLVRERHTARILYGACLWCGHEQHETGCAGDDYWGRSCGCAEFIPRTLSLMEWPA